MKWPDDFMNKIICGDCLEVMREMPDNCVDLVLTSPPYPGNNKMWGELFRGENCVQAHNFLSTVWEECVRVLKNGCKLTINIANTKRRPYIPNTFHIYKCLLPIVEPLGEIIWSKGYGQLGTRHKEPGYKINARDFKSWRNSIWNIAPEKATKIGHVAPFPETIPNRLIQLYSYKNEIILDPFLGSGTTTRVAKDLKRNFIGIEINPEYCKIAEERLAQGVL